MQRASQPSICYQQSTNTAMKIHQHSQALLNSIKLVDFFLVAGLLYLLAAAKYFYFGGGLHPDLHVTVALVGAAILQFLASISEFYRSITERANGKHITRILAIWLITCALMLLWGFVVGETDKFSRSVIGLWFALTPVVLVAWHLSIRVAVARIRANSASDVVVFGAGEVGEKFAREVQHSPWLGYKIAGFFDDKRAEGEMVSGMPVLGSIADGIELAKKSQWRKAYIALPLKAQDKIQGIIDQLADSAVDIELIPDIFGFELINAKISQIGSLPIIALQASPISGYNAALKRLMDIVVSAAILAITSPLLLAIALAIKIENPNLPIIFKQRRCGLNGKEVVVWKFRTMTVLEDGDRVEQAKENDSRTTKLGKLLRRLSLDELPQLINVISGSMSLVGPRPHAITHAKNFRRVAPTYMRRHLVKPGITGWMQINGMRGEVDSNSIIHKRAELDLYYVQNWSLWLDVKIIALTALREFGNKRAY